MKKLLTLCIAFFAAGGLNAQVSHAEETRSEDVNIYTDPVRRIVKVVYYTSLNSEMRFSILTESGEIVLRSSDNVGKGEHSKLIDLGKYPREKYRIVVENARMKQEEVLAFN